MVIASVLSVALLGLGADFPRNPAVPMPQVIFAQATSPSYQIPAFDAARCRGIADLSASSRPTLIQKDNGEWECTYMLEYPETAHDPSVFIQIRGTQANVWSSFRLKLNFGSILSRQVLGQRAAALVYALIGDQTPMRELGMTLAAGRDFEISFDGMTLRYRRERMDDQRYNLIGTRSLGRQQQVAPAP